MLYRDEQMARVADGSDKLKVSEDRKEIGRKEPLTDEMNEERISRTVKVRRTASITPDVLPTDLL